MTQAGSIRPVGADRQLANEDVVTPCEICSSSVGHPRALGTGGGQRQQRGSRYFYLYPKLLQCYKSRGCQDAHTSLDTAGHTAGCFDPVSAADMRRENRYQNIYTGLHVDILSFPRKASLVRRCVAGLG